MHNFADFLSATFKKTQKLPTKFPALATSGRHNSTVITDRPKLTAKIALYRMSSFHFCPKNQFSVFPVGCMLHTCNNFLATSDVNRKPRTSQVCSCCC